MLIQRIQANTGYLTLLHVTSGYYRLFQVTTDYFRLLQSTTGYHKQTYQTDKLPRIKQCNVSYCLTIYWGSSVKEYLVHYITQLIPTMICGIYDYVCSLRIIRHCMFPREHTVPYVPLYDTVCSLVCHRKH